MRSKITSSFIILFGLIVLSPYIYAQRIPDPNTGKISFRRQGIMDGNLVRTIFINWGEIAHWPDQPSGEWPKGTGHQYVDGVALIVQAKTIDNNGNVIYPLETQYREFVDKGPNDELWGWAPLPGYFNPRQNEPAMSDDPNTWPDKWPDKPEWVNPNEILNGIDDDKNGMIDDIVFWNGFFGKGVRNADLETYMVFDDDPDEEWNFFPDPADTTRRGLGLEVSGRYFQWSQVLAEDVIFAIYFITNEGKTDYDSTYYSFYIDWGIGGTDDSSDDSGDYNKMLDIAWAWDYDGFGTPGRWSPVGVCGFAFLESPGIQNDAKDNDDDGLVDERKDSGPGVFLDSYPYGVIDVDAYRNYYEREPVPHWSGDEDGDWVGFEDLNQNGVWDSGEPLHDDVGKDGIGPYELNYQGPDEGEADGIPTPGESNFDFLDKDESDQIGLTGFEIFPVHKYELWNETQDWDVWRKALPPREGLQVTANLGMFFSSGPFPLKAGQTENYSMALIFAEDANDLARTKKTVQQIYNADYRFAKPPEKPILTAIPGDKKVVLIWDDRAEQSWDPFLQKFDFEGYRIYRSTEPEFLETRLITDSYGRKTFRKPLAQFDLKDNIKGLHPMDVEGVKYNLGTDSGLRHIFIDENVQNGQTYYYAVVSYDQGDVDTSATGEIEGITPAECGSIIKQDIAGNIETDINTAVVTPNPASAGYRPPELIDDIEHIGPNGRLGPGTGTLKMEFIVPDSVKNKNTYEVIFEDTSLFHHEGAVWYKIMNVTNNPPIEVVPKTQLFEETESPLYDGMVVRINNEPRVKLNPFKTGWLIGNSNYKVFIDFDPRFTSETIPLFNINISYPADFEITFTNAVSDTSDNKIGFPATPVKFKIWNMTEDKPASFLFKDFIADQTLSPDTTEYILLYVDNPDNNLKVSTTWRIYFETDTLASEQRVPQPGDIYRISTYKPFRTNEKFRFKVKGASFNNELAKQELDDIIVVPNPYVVGASWEPKSPFRFGRGERRLWFMNLPPECTIRIYTTRGYLIDTIEHSGTESNSAASWDLVSKDGMDIAYGIYIYHIEAPNIGEKIGKFAVIK